MSIKMRITIWVCGACLAITAFVIVFAAVLGSAVESGDAENAMHVFTVLTASLVPSLVVLAIGGGWLISWGALRQFKKINDKVDEIVDGNDLSKRLDIKKGPKEVRKLAGTFDRMFDRLEVSFEAEKQFTSDASHELRTPVTVIMAECDRAKRKVDDKAKVLESLDVISEQGERMTALIEQLLGLTRIAQKTDRFPLEEGSLSDIVKSTAEDFEPEDKKGIDLWVQVEQEISFRFNSLLISRLVINLLQNAYKYGKENGHIFLSLKENRDEIILDVADDGIGISKEQQGKIFDRFYQADASREESKGSGLGLSMCKEIAEFHGGSIEVRSAEGEGSTFSVVFKR